MVRYGKSSVCVTGTDVDTVSAAAVVATAVATPLAASIAWSWSAATSRFHSARVMSARK